MQKLHSVNKEKLAPWKLVKALKVRFIKITMTGAFGIFLSSIAWAESVEQNSCKNELRKLVAEAPFSYFFKPSKVHSVPMFTSRHLKYGVCGDYEVLEVPIFELHLRGQRKVEKSPMEECMFYSNRFVISNGNVTHSLDRTAEPIKIYESQNCTVSIRKNHEGLEFVEALADRRDLNSIEICQMMAFSTFLGAPYFTNEILKLQSIEDTMARTSHLRTIALFFIESLGRASDEKFTLDEMITGMHGTRACSYLEAMRKDFK